MKDQQIKPYNEDQLDFEHPPMEPEDTDSESIYTADDEGTECTENPETDYQDIEEEFQQLKKSFFKKVALEEKADTDYILHPSKQKVTLPDVLIEEEILSD